MSSINNVPSVEFVIIPREDLYLIGPKRINTLKRVEKGTCYPCVMQKPQSFSSMFRHYAKHNGLDKSTLRFFFVEELEENQTPESVALMPHDVIYVSHSTMPKPQNSSVQKRSSLTDSLEKLLNDNINDLSDVAFRVGSSEEIFQAHKAILCARSPYFAAMFRPGGMRESTADEVRIPLTHPCHFKRILEFIYTSRVEKLTDCSMEDIFELGRCASEYLLSDLQEICEETIMNAVNLETICACMELISKGFGSPALLEYCQDFVVANIEKLRNQDNFRSMVSENPSMALILVDYVTGNQKKRKREDSTILKDK